MALVATRNWLLVWLLDTVNDCALAMPRSASKTSEAVAASDTPAGMATVFNVTAALVIGLT